jgi:hypothetical protein
LIKLIDDSEAGWGFAVVVVLLTTFEGLSYEQREAGAIWSVDDLRFGVTWKLFLCR